MDKIIINDNLRLRKFNKEEYYKALPWYEDEQVQYYTNGVKTPYGIETIGAMYDYLSSHGHCYYIEVLCKDQWKAIGDASLVENTSDDVPITIGDKEYWGNGIGREVLQKLIEIAKDFGRQELKVEIYDFNERSYGLYRKLGFKEEEPTEKGHIYRLKLR